MSSASGMAVSQSQDEWQQIPSSDRRNGVKENNGTYSDSGTSADEDEDSILDTLPSTTAAASIPGCKTSDGDISKKYPEDSNIGKLEKRKQDIVSSTSLLPPKADVFQQPKPLTDSTNGVEDCSSSNGSGRERAVFHITEEYIPRFKPSTVKIPEITHPCKLPVNYILPGPPLPVPQMILPCMRGTLSHDIENRHHVCSGIWGMSVVDTDRGKTSPFEFKRVVESNEPFPSCGLYSGYFMLRTAVGGDVSLKRVEEPEIELQFIKNTEGGYNVVGKGKNEFGCYTIAGTLSKEFKLQVFREYDSQKALRVQRQSNSRGKESLKDIQNPDRRNGAQITSNSKNSSNLSVLPLYSNTNSTNNSKAENLSHPSMRRRVSRTPSYLLDQAKEPAKMTEPIRKCHKLLGQLCSVKERSIWFIAPVDYVSLNLIDYPRIVKEPIDFGTIRKKMECGLYEGPAQFAREVRLVFSNAILYNSDPNSAVRIAAQELSEMFETKFTQLANSLSEEPSNELKRRNSVPPNLGGGGGSMKRHKPTGKMPRSSPVGPRQKSSGFSVGGGYPSQLVEMQRRMEEMQATILQLQRRQSQQGGFPSGKFSTSSQDLNSLNTPEVLASLTWDEKRELSAAINNLNPDKLAGVVNIIQERMPLDVQNEEDAEIVIDIDSMDTGTLRELQSYVASCQPKKRKASGRAEIGVGDISDSDSEIEGDWP